ncbi:MAG: hypothetical protein AB1659_08250, partial [Thermodesulfobacteriota bacterium]
IVKPKLSVLNHDKRIYKRNTNAFNHTPSSLHLQQTQQSLNLGETMGWFTEGSGGGRIRDIEPAH